MRAVERWPCLSMVVLFFLIAALSTQKDSGTLTLIGERGRVETLTPGQLAELAQTELTVREPDSGLAVFRGPTVASLMRRVGAPGASALRGPDVLLVVLAEAADGYRVVYSLAELDPQSGGHETILALSQDGRPLSTDDGPLRVVMSGATPHSRWIRQVIRLRLMRVSPR